MKNGKRVAIVTGSSRGIGKAIAIELGKKDFNIVVNNHREDDEAIKTQHEVRKTGADCLYIRCDISDYEATQAMIRETLEKFGKIDVLVNNAGIIIDKLFHNMEPDDWNRVLSVNLTGSFNCIKAVLPHMKSQHSGQIVNISSVIGETGNIGQANYAASKGGMLSLTRSLAKELAHYNILVNCIAPGFIRTRMLDNVPSDLIQKLLGQIPLGRFGEPEEIARCVAFLCSGDAAYITGQVININGGLYM